MNRRVSLRARLFATYLILLAVTFGVIALVFIVILNTRPAPPGQTYQRLAAIAQGVPFGEILAQTGIDYATTPAQRRALIEAQLQQIADERNVRLLVLGRADSRVLFDSAATLPVGTALSLDTEPYTIPAAIRRGFTTRVEAFFGNFADTSGRWLFAGLLASGPLGGASAALLFADPLENQSLQQALADFSSALALPLCQSALVGLVVAFILAILGSRSIARPLLHLAVAAENVADGHYSQRVPEEGPPEVRGVAESFNNMTAQVQRTQQAQQDFLANVSHDLKTPLTSIQGYSQAIIDGAAAEPVNAARIIHQEAARLNRMVVELTDLARLQAGRLSMQTSRVDVGRVAAAVGEQLAVVAREKGVTLAVETAPVPEIEGDGDRLAQVLTNLVSNAIKYTPPGGAVRVLTRPANGGVEVAVHDTGIGIAAGELPRIFERFYQVDKARGPERGTGLGLAIAQEIVQAHGGHLSAGSAGPGLGATFTVWLPLPAAASNAARRR